MRDRKINFRSLTQLDQEIFLITFDQFMNAPLMKCTIVLAWLKNDRKYKQFVSNRTQEILKLTRPEIWRHCPTDSNPADIGTRGVTCAFERKSSVVPPGGGIGTYNFVVPRLSEPLF